MRELEEACIIHSVEDYAQALYFNEFWKWVGISYFECVYNECNADLNHTLLEGKNQFSFIVYIGEKADSWIKMFGHLSNVNIKIESEELWDAEGKLKTSIMDRVWGQLFARIAPGNEKLPGVFQKLTALYCEYDVLRKLLNNKYSLFMYAKTADYKGIKKNEYRVMLDTWKLLIAELKKLSAETGKGENCGKEYIGYADGYCKRKVNELCNLLGNKRRYETKAILKSIDSLYDYDEKFYMIESLKAHVVSIDPNYRLWMITYLINCVNTCGTDASNSFHYYRLGKKYELIDRREKAEKEFAASYRNNRLNFRALFKLAVYKMLDEDSETAQKYLLDVLTILQLYDGNRFCLDHLKKLPPLELQYASKCFVLLGDLTVEKESGTAEKYYKMTSDVVAAAEGNDFMKKMYPELARQGEQEIYILENLKDYLTQECVRRKLQAINARRRRR